MNGVERKTMSETNSIDKIRPELSGLVMAVALLALYGLAVFAPVQWVWAQMSGFEQGVALLALPVAALACLKYLGPPARGLPVLALLLIAVCALLSRASFHILQQVSASFALLGLYGFAPIFSRLTPALWRQGFILAGLAALAMPFALVPGTGAGFYLRLLTADISAALLAVIGHGSLGANDVLIFENGIAQVDIPCSGLKSLFTGTDFFLAASLILKRPISWRWIGVYGFFVFCLLSANIIRVTVLIFLSEILEWREFADQIHTALGLALFTINCLIAILLLRRIPLKDLSGTPFGRSKFGYGLPAAAVMLASIFAIGQTLPVWDDHIAAPNLSVMSDVDLTETERRFFAARGQTQARKWRFAQDGLSGSILVVKSRAANGLHAPEMCLMGNGLRIDSMVSRSWDHWQVQKGKGAFRALSLNEENYSAVYWMQSRQMITDDFRKRLTQYALGRHNEWIMVTILFDQGHRLDKIEGKDPAIAGLMSGLQAFYEKEYPS